MKSYYISKYAPTKGILTQQTDEELEQENGSINVVLEGKTYTLGKGVFASLDDARRDAIKRTRRKVSALFAKEGRLELEIEKWESELPS